MNNGFMMKSCVSTSGLSNHLPIVFKLEPGGVTPPAPLKFNLIWLEEDDYRALVVDSWVHLSSSDPSPLTCQFAENINRVKVATRQ
jgi:hypothetical protein